LPAAAPSIHLKFEVQCGSLGTRGKYSSKVSKFLLSRVSTNPHSERPEGLGGGRGGGAAGGGQQHGHKHQYIYRDSFLVLFKLNYDNSIYLAIELLFII
jgi:hypothetical protein